MDVPEATSSGASDAVPRRSFLTATVAGAVLTGFALIEATDAAEATEWVPIADRPPCLA
ncbi:hypothetical protein [Agromyces cerinus]|uniref:Tat (Twin-arginine translocation) pathway signal sequence n=1 Tax=Agromyces cerinus subsp. cerinus TaxID=232089 RepID=A0A1N6I9R6_9MICO|nr:hypothetical protein [Agromyces cerinus]SIO28756.1 hypothetical protein SAMN05443544_3805 [Agromyces cerinus subsp. cerinus]